MTWGCRSKQAERNTAPPPRFAADRVVLAARQQAGNGRKPGLNHQLAAPAQKVPKVRLVFDGRETARENNDRYDLPASASTRGRRAYCAAAEFAFPPPRGRNLPTARVAGLGGGKPVAGMHTPIKRRADIRTINRRICLLFCLQLCRPLACFDRAGIRNIQPGSTWPLTRLRISKIQLHA